MTKKKVFLDKYVPFNEKRKYRYGFTVKRPSLSTLTKCLILILLVF